MLTRCRRTAPLSAYALRVSMPISVVYRSANSLLATEITLRRLDGDMTQEELDLVQISSGFATQTRHVLSSCTCLSPRCKEAVHMRCRYRDFLSLIVHR